MNRSTVVLFGSRFSVFIHFTHLSKFFLFIDQLLAARNHLVESVQPVLQPLDGFHILIIQLGDGVTTVCEERLDDARVKLSKKELQDICIFFFKPSHIYDDFFKKNN